MYLCIALVCLTGRAWALEPIRIEKEVTALDLTEAVEIHRDQGADFQVSTVPGADGIVRRIEVQANTPETAGTWAVFALANNTDAQIDRLIVAPHFRLVGSGLQWPDLGSTRIVSITPSEGFALDREASIDADVFSITLNPGTIITFVAELASPNLPQLYIWEPDAYKDTVNSYTLYRGIVLGISGLLALFLTILFVVRGTAMFPATAALAWAVLAYISIDFGYLSKLIELAPGSEQTWRAVTESALAAAFALFLFTYLNLARWQGYLALVAVIWFGAMLAVLGLSFYDPPMAAGLARMSIAATAAAGVLLIAWFGFKGFDRAVLLIPTWLLILAWLTGGWMTVTGRIDNDIIQPALAGGLVLIVLLIGFTVMQHAFGGSGLAQGLFSDMERQALAITGSDGVVWDWDVVRDRIVTNPPIDARLGIASGSLLGPARTWLNHIHHDDRDRFRTTLDILLEHRRGKLSLDFRLRARDGHYAWYALRARPVVGATGEVIRCIGAISDVTEQKNAEERLLHDAVHDNLTGLPNR
ncbi:MAG TPA: PAS domain-containing protein, partial [Rhizobiaceae bacterium]|nr:PAS domain-containing protein [Rhizobiaceae bacterium]